MAAHLGRRWRPRVAVLAQPAHTGLARGARRQRRYGSKDGSSPSSTRSPAQRPVGATIESLRSGFLLALGASAVLGFLIAQATYLAGRLSLDGMLGASASCAAMVLAIALSTGASAVPHASTR